MKSEEKPIQDKEILTNYIIKKFNGALLLKKHEASIILNRSIPSLDRDRANSKGPAFKKDASGNVYYTVISIVDFLLNTQDTLESQGIGHE